MIAEFADRQLIERDDAGERQLDRFHKLIPAPPCGRRGCPRQVILELVAVGMQLRCLGCGGVAPYRKTASDA
jgi:hypothetical protein